MKTSVASHRPGRERGRLATWVVPALLSAVCLVAVLRPPTVAVASVPGPAFPRLAAWWPDCDDQSSADLARFDWIALQSSDADHIAGLRAARPDVALLASTNARELNYVLGDYDNPRNIELRGASTDWILTQLGSTLTASVTTSATSIPVSDTSRFAKGELALVDHELVHIVSVGTSFLTVTRGQVDPASPHEVGTRIASVVAHWPDSVTFDMSTGCVKADVGHGPETWNEWNARRAGGIVDAADWDGIFVDCLETDTTWMIRDHIIRSIDPTRSNIPVADDYAVFNAAWAAGGVEYGNALRNEVGDKFVVGNGNVRNFSLNGTVFEDFPRSDLAPSIWERVFAGPWVFPHASYAEWCAATATPNLTLVQTYGTPTDYKMMRWGLCSALMNDGYFTFSGTAHSASGLYWFDEYDNSGAGRGYLGQPSGEATRVGLVWRRDYENGIALVNPSGSPATVALHGTFRKIAGRQAPKVNDGTVATAVTIPAQDGIVLLRVPVLGASSTALADGRQTTLRVTAVRAPETAMSLEQRTAGTTVWKRVATLTADAAGASSIARAPHVTTEYRVVLAGSRAVSNTVKVGVRPRASIRASRTRVRRWARVVLSGSVSYPGSVPLTLQRRIHGVWKTVRRLRTSAAGRYRTTVSFANRASYSYRVRVAATVRHLATVSGTVKITVR